MAKEEIQKHRESFKHVRVSIQINVMAKDGTLFVRTVHECGLLDFFTERLDPWVFSKIFQCHNQFLTQRGEDTFVRIKEEMFDGHQESWGKIESGRRMSKADLKTRISSRLSDQMRQRLSFLLGGSRFVSLAAKYDDYHFLQEQAKFDFGLMVVRFFITAHILFSTNGFGSSLLLLSHLVSRLVSCTCTFGHIF
mgnify:CR=1 FL=1